MSLTPDKIVYWQSGPVVINATLVFTWIVMAIMVIGAWMITRRLTSDPEMSRGQNMLEIIVMGMLQQIKDISQQAPERYLAFIGTLFLFILVCNVLAIVPGFQPPTGSLTTTAALAVCGFVAVPYFGIRSRGVKGYLRQYVEPSIIMLPFNIIGELSRTVALMFRLFGNIMSGSMIAAILLVIVPFVFPIVMHALGLLTGAVQAYIFAVLVMVYIASATRQQGSAEDAADKGDG